jgi:hypothetical protein
VAGAFRVVLEKGRPMSTGGGLGIFHRQSGQPMLSAADRDGDGRLDVVTYAVVDGKGELLMDVVDYEADGQPDFRLHVKEQYFEVWHKDRWYRAEKRGATRGIVMNGKFVELQRVDNRWTVRDAAH